MGPSTKPLTNIRFLGWLMTRNPELARENHCSMQQSWDCYLRNTFAFSFWPNYLQLKSSFYLYFSVKRIIFNHLLSYSLTNSRSSLSRVMNSIVSCKGVEHPLTTASSVHTMLENGLCFARIEKWLSTWLL